MYELKNKYIRHSHLKESVFLQLLEMFCLDRSAAQASKGTRVSRRVVSRLFQKFRFRLHSLSTVVPKTARLNQETLVVNILPAPNSAMLLQKQDKVIFLKGFVLHLRPSKTVARLAFTNQSLISTIDDLISLTKARRVATISSRLGSFIQEKRRIAGVDVVTLSANYNGSVALSLKFDELKKLVGLTDSLFRYCNGRFRRPHPNTNSSFASVVTESAFRWESSPKGIYKKLKASFVRDPL